MPTRFPISYTRFALLLICSMLLACPDARASLIEVVKTGDLEAVQKELNASSEAVNETDDGGATALHYATKLGLAEITGILLAADANPDARTAKGTTPLHLAIVSRNPGIVATLLNSGADIDVSTKKGATPLHYAVNAKDPKMVAFLLKLGADTTAETSSGMTAPELARRTGQVDILALFGSSDRSEPPPETVPNERPAIVAPELGNPAPSPIRTPAALRRNESPRLPGDARTPNWVRKEVAEGAVYEGEWSDGAMHGQGTLSFENGERYQGQWRNGRRHGEGVQVYPDGTRYKGDWLNGARQGFGIADLGDEESYQGSWSNNLRHGQGTYTFSSGGRITGTWENGELKEGTGSYGWEDRAYTGQWKNNRRNGQGTLRTRAGDIQSGLWQDNVLAAPARN